MFLGELGAWSGFSHQALVLCSPVAMVILFWMKMNPNRSEPEKQGQKKRRESTTAKRRQSQSKDRRASNVSRMSIVPQSLEVDPGAMGRFGQHPRH